MPHTASLTVLVLFCSVAVYTDLKSGVIPNLLNLFGLAGGFIVSILVEGIAGLAGSVAGALLGFSILIAPFLLHMVGGGDLKFFTAAGSIVGWRILWSSFLAGAALGGLIGIALILIRDRSLVRLRHRLVLLQAGVWHKPPSLAQCEDESQPASGKNGLRMPYSIPLSAGLVIVTSVYFFGHSW